MLTILLTMVALAQDPADAGEQPAGGADEPEKVEEAGEPAAEEAQGDAAQPDEAPADEAPADEAAPAEEAAPPEPVESDPAAETADTDICDPLSYAYDVEACAELLGVTEPAVAPASLQQWVGTWRARRHDLTLVVQQEGDFRLDFDQDEAQCFMEGTLLSRNGRLLFGSVPQREAHEAAVAEEQAVLRALEAAVDAAEDVVIKAVRAKPKHQKRYEKEGYVFVDELGGKLTVDLPPGAPELEALAEGRAVKRHCDPTDSAHPTEIPLLATLPTMFFERDASMVALFIGHEGKEQFFRLVKPGAKPPMARKGTLGGGWVAREGEATGEALMWGELTAEDNIVEIRWHDGCTEWMHVIKSSMAFSFDTHRGECDRLGSFRRIWEEGGGMYELRSEDDQPAVLLRLEESL